MALDQTMLNLEKGNDYWSEAQFWAHGTLPRVSYFPGSSPSTFENMIKGFLLCLNGVLAPRVIIVCHPEKAL